MKSLELTHIRGELEDVGNTLSLLMEISSSGQVLSERSQAGLVDVGSLALARLEEAVARLRRYEAEATAS